MANTNKVLNKAGVAKKDEFYTQLTDIEKEMRYYREYFADCRAKRTSVPYSADSLRHN